MGERLAKNMIKEVNFQKIFFSRKSDDSFLSRMMLKLGTNI